jgi:ABC transporter with metal-binding/Fe-S-binding domain ATP-binding protein
MYHVPATDLTALAAESVGIDLVDVRPEEFATVTETHDSAARGDEEVAPLEAALVDLDEKLSFAGVVAGAVESEYQTSRIEAMAERLGVDTFTPLWQCDPWTVAEEMLAADFEVVVVQVAAAGLDESWLGRTWDRAALSDLRDLADRYGVHPLGEGGEFETLVVDGPHMDRRIELEYDTEWDGTRGRLDITDAYLA